MMSLHTSYAWSFMTQHCPPVSVVLIRLRDCVVHSSFWWGGSLELMLSVILHTHTVVCIPPLWVVHTVRTSANRTHVPHTHTHTRQIEPALWIFLACVLACVIPVIPVMQPGKPSLEAELLGLPKPGPNRLLFKEKHVCGSMLKSDGSALAEDLGSVCSTHSLGS